MLSDVSIIIPMSLKEQKPTHIINLIEKSSPKTEIILSHENSRAKSLNTGSKKAKGRFLWFIHADTIIDESNLVALQNSIYDNSDSLHYFDLDFYDGSPALKLNSIGVWFRSHILKCPFGDQAFCISKEIFLKIGGFPENVEYGEDHLFLWNAKHEGIKLYPTDSIVKTSARKYNKNGWIKTTFCHLFLWLKQAVPQFLKNLKVG